MFVYNFEREKDEHRKFRKSREEICRLSLYFKIAVVKKYLCISSLNLIHAELQSKCWQHVAALWYMCGGGGVKNGISLIWLYVDVSILSHHRLFNNRHSIPYEFMKRKVLLPMPILDWLSTRELISWNLWKLFSDCNSKNACI